MDAIVIGAGSAIGRATAEQLDTLAEVDRVWRILRQPAQETAPADHHLYTDHSEQSIADCIAALAAAHCTPLYIIICLGKLHGEQVSPERRIEEFSVQSAEDVMRVNAFLPLAWLRQLTPLLKHSSPCRIATLSARVGSIGDNRLGGWYTYRASKAALNMLLKTLSVELARRAPNVKLIAFHPGTVDTPLSAPFQARVPEGQLFTPEFVARQLIQILQEAEPDGQLDYLDWAGKPVQW